MRSLSTNPPPEHSTRAGLFWACCDTALRKSQKSSTHVLLPVKRCQCDSRLFLSTALLLLPCVPMCLREHLSFPWKSRGVMSFYPLPGEAA